MGKTRKIITEIVTKVTGADKVDDLADATDDAQSGLDKMTEKAQGLPGPLGDAAAIMAGPAGLAAGAGAIAVGLFQAADRAANLAIEADNMANFMGSTVEEADKMLQVFGKAGIEANDLQDIIAQTAGVLADSADLAADLGINMDSTPAEQFLQAVEAIQRETDATTKLNLGASLFGEEGVRQMNGLISMLDGPVTDAIDDVDARFDEAGVEQAREMQKEMAEVSKEISNAATELGVAVLPAITDVVAAAADLAGFLSDAADFAGKFSVDLGGSDEAQKLIDLAKAAEYAANETEILADEMAAYYDAINLANPTVVEMTGSLEVAGRELERLEGQTSATASVFLDLGDDATDAADDVTTAIDKIQGKLSNQRAALQFKDNIASAMETARTEIGLTEQDVIDLQLDWLALAEQLGIPIETALTINDGLADEAEQAMRTAVIIAQNYANRNPVKIQAIVDFGNSDYNVPDYPTGNQNNSLTVNVSGNNSMRAVDTSITRWQRLNGIK